MMIFRNSKLEKLLFFVFTIILSLNSIPSLSTSPDNLPYADHCNSVVPDSTSKAYRGFHPFAYRHTGYYYTGGGTGNPNSTYDGHQIGNSVELLAWNVLQTNVQGLFRLQATLHFEQASKLSYVGKSNSQPRYRYPGGDRSQIRRGTVRFILRGFWSELTAKLCMVGYGYSFPKKGTVSKHPAVFKLYNVLNSTSIRSLISGTVESLSNSSDNIKDPRYFNPISILLLPRMNYQYTLVPNRYDDQSHSTGIDENELPTSLQLESFCSLATVALKQEFDLKYPSKCFLANNCTPSDHLPLLMSFKDMEYCLEDKRRLRVLVEFSKISNRWYQRPFHPCIFMLAEGSWDANKSQINFVACSFLQATTNSFNNSRIGDCSTRLSMRFPAKWTIGHTSNVLGHIWSNKSKTELGYLEKITFESRQFEAGKVLIPGQTYEYTKIDQVTKLCPRKKSAGNGHNRYPTPFSFDMKFDMSARSSKGLVAWGSAEPLSVGNQFYEQYLSSIAMAEDENYSSTPFSSPVMSYSSNCSNPTNISYKMSILLFERSAGKSGNTTMQISSEGVYDDTDGSLCMTGCRNVGLNRNLQIMDSLDCEILVKFQFPPTNQDRNNTGFIKVSIESTRKKSDPLSFERLDLSSATGYKVEAERSIWRMDMEITLVLISTTLACVSVAFQLFHVKKHPDVLPFISVVMLLILTVGYMMPLMVNVDAILMKTANHQDVLLGTGGWLAVNEVLETAITTVALLLQFRLLQQAWTARSMSGMQKELCHAEKVVLLVYAIGASAAMALLMYLSHEKRPIIFGPLKSYASLVLDGFLFPQILLNMVRISNEQALSAPFYLVTTFVRVLPHAYDLYRRHSTAHPQFDESYIYASPVAAIYSTCGDVIVSTVSLLFCVIIFLQQKFGGRCFLPQELREPGSYTKVDPTISEAELPK